MKSSSDYSIVNMHGRLVQKQDGIDVYARKNENNKWIGLQCKVRSTNRAFSKQELLVEVNMTEDFNPKISEYFIHNFRQRCVHSRICV